MTERFYRVGHKYRDLTKRVPEDEFINWLDTDGRTIGTTAGIRPKRCVHGDMRATGRSQRSETRAYSFRHRRMLQMRLLSWAQDNPVHFPWRRRVRCFHALSVEILLQRTRADQVVPVFEKFRTEYPTAEALACSRVSAVRRVIHPLGLLWRAKYLKQLGQKLVTDRRIPDSFEGLTSLPGVGLYAASAYLSLHRGIRRPIVDSNVVRLYCRLLGVSYGAETRREEWLGSFAESVTPRKRFKEFNYALLDFTRAVCRPKARCAECPLTDICGSAFTAKALRPRVPRKECGV